ncbi:Clan SC, family S28, unassigned serine peptidase [Trichomonas vaginalis G3]|uniref:Clan SC, family S28, unassigned serine peptidase n=1 Tax=Trichomonas vaginalis (strain ATCC PRA-98 / G3) TaxID=412133 RepID=A2DUU4_TRIV3|nr:serine-type peptidase protein [Trichomonas vaginalis G3]EAY15829.1 Clan SC, family S28, unassigned serine peptidase [Trichomonas vaginalis G3]KAI5525002.1 serine-type peptidase protein [Trichomonas vaginalis G3]|eukprot:XP_001328052.1 Clan SC, family S28, unassigned serine peptidase [Trichomonas vaginalis G3]
MIGGSYAGSLSSWFRQKHPELALGSWASSAPIFAKLNFSEYDKHEAEDFMEYGCYENVLNAYKTIEKVALLQNDKTEELMMMFGVPNPEEFVSHSLEFLDMFSYAYTYGNQYKAWNQIILDMCDSLKEIDTSDSDEVIGVMATTSYLLGMDKFLELYPNGLKNTSVDSPNKASRGWAYMMCNEFGWFYSASGLLKSNLLTIQYYSDFCQNIFGKQPDPDKFNEKYGGYNPNVTRVVYTNSHYDSWSELTMKRNDTSKSIYSFSINDGFHCDDIHDPNDSDSISLMSVREESIKLLLKWMEEKEEGRKEGGKGEGKDEINENAPNKPLPTWAWIVIAMTTTVVLVTIIVIVIIYTKLKGKISLSTDEIKE